MCMIFLHACMYVFREHYLMQLGHEADHIRQLRKLWRSKIDVLNNNADNNAFDPEGGSDGLLTNGPSTDRGSSSAPVSAVEMQMKLKGDFNSIRNKQQQFKDEFRNELAHQHGIEPSRLRITKLSPGSIVIDFKVFKKTSGGGAGGGGDDDLRRLVSNIKDTSKLGRKSSFFSKYKPDPQFQVTALPIRENVNVSGYGGVGVGVVSEATREGDTSYGADKKFHKVGVNDIGELFGERFGEIFDD